MINPACGDLVEYVLPDESKNGGQCRPAIIVETRPAGDRGFGDTLDVGPLKRGDSPFIKAGNFARGVVAIQDDDGAPGTWHAIGG